MDKTAEKIRVYGENFSLSQLREYEDAIYTDKIDSVKRCRKAASPVQAWTYRKWNRLQRTIRSMTWKT